MSCMLLPDIPYATLASSFLSAVRSVCSCLSGCHFVLLERERRASLDVCVRRLAAVAAAVEPQFRWRVLT